MRFWAATVKTTAQLPVRVKSRHKQVALQYAGFWQALMFGSEGGIDGSNLPYSYVSLTLRQSRGVGAENPNPHPTETPKKRLRNNRRHRQNLQVPQLLFYPKTPPPQRDTFSGRNLHLRRRQNSQVQKKLHPSCGSGCNLGAAKR